MRSLKKALAAPTLSSPAGTWHCLDASRVRQYRQNLRGSSVQGFAKRGDPASDLLRFLFGRPRLSSVSLQGHRARRAGAADLPSIGVCPHYLNKDRDLPLCLALGHFHCEPGGLRE